VLQVVQATLKKNGYEVDAHQSGADALNSFEPGVFALAILDITMPGMDGIELLTRLRERDPELRAFFISGHASDALRDRLRKFDGIRVLSKPFSLADLIRVTREEVS
jgi:CheY-like chemotaxis protein